MVRLPCRMTFEGFNSSGASGWPHACVCVHLYPSPSCPSISSPKSVSVTVFARGGYPTSWQFDLGKEIGFWCWRCETNVVFAPLLTLFVDMCVCACERLSEWVQYFIYVRKGEKKKYLDQRVCVHVCCTAWLKDVLVECYRVVSAACLLSPGGEVVRRGGYWSFKVTDFDMNSTFLSCTQVVVSQTNKTVPLSDQVEYLTSLGFLCWERWSMKYKKWDKITGL